MIGNQAAIGVSDTAGREGHDHANRLAQVVALGWREGWQGCRHDRSGGKDDGHRCVNEPASEEVCAGCGRSDAHGSALVMSLFPGVFCCDGLLGKVL